MTLNAENINRRFNTYERAISNPQNQNRQASLLNERYTYALECFKEILEAGQADKINFFKKINPENLAFILANNEYDPQYHSELIKLLIQSVPQENLIILKEELAYYKLGDNNWLQQVMLTEIPIHCKEFFEGLFEQFKPTDSNLASNDWSPNRSPPQHPSIKTQLKNILDFIFDIERYSDLLPEYIINNFRIIANTSKPSDVPELASKPQEAILNYLFIDIINTGMTNLIEDSKPSTEEKTHYKQLLKLIIEIFIPPEQQRGKFANEIYSENEAQILAFLNFLNSFIPESKIAPAFETVDLGEIESETPTQNLMPQSNKKESSCERKLTIGFIGTASSLLLDCVLSLGVAGLKSLQSPSTPFNTLVNETLFSVDQSILLPLSAIIGCIAAYKASQPAPVEESLRPNRGYGTMQL